MGWEGFFTSYGQELAVTVGVYVWGGEGREAGDKMG